MVMAEQQVTSGYATGEYQKLAFVCRYNKYLRWAGHDAIDRHDIPDVASTNTKVQQALHTLTSHIQEQR
jgi:hypothetical protein